MPPRTRGGFSARFTARFTLLQRTGANRASAATTCNENCCFYALFSGNSLTHGPLSVLPVLEERGVPVIALTSVGDNLLRQRAAYTLSISSYERLYSKISTFATENSILYILNVLFACCFAADYDANMARKVGTSRRLESERITTEQALREE